MPADERGQSGRRQILSPFAGLGLNQFQCEDQRAGQILDERLASFMGANRLREHDLAQHVIAQHQPRPQQSICNRFEMIGDPTDEMQMAAIAVRRDKCHG